MSCDARRSSFTATLIAVSLTVSLAIAQPQPTAAPPKATAAPTKPAPTAVPSATAQPEVKPSAGPTVFEKTETVAPPPGEKPVTMPVAAPGATPSGTATPPGAVPDKAPIVTPDGKPAETGEIPVPVKVKETQPMGGTITPPDNTPELSAPVPPPQTVVTPPVRYFVTIFGSESYPKRGRFTHTWYTIVKATPKKELGISYDPQGNQIEYYDLLAHTISWMPASLRIRVLKLRAECGVNLDLHKTIRYVRGQCECIAMWGPYEVNPLVAEELYDKSVKQIARLNSGRVLYKSLDPDNVNICNCIHAVTDLDGPRLRSSRYDEVRNFGIAASAHLVNIIAASNRLDTSVTHEWVAEALDLTKYRMQRRQPAVRPQPRTVATVQSGGAPASKR